MSLRVAVDIGGTFTDLACFDEKTGRVTLAKVPSTPPAFDAGVLKAISSAGISVKDVTLLVHGTTVVINAITQRRGARTGLLTTRGMRDVLEIARGNRPDIYNLRYRKPEPFVPRHLRLEVRERLDARGNVLEEMSDDEVRAAARLFRTENVEAVAVCFLHAYANPDHERRAGAILAEELPTTFVSLSHEVTREFREYERSSTTVLNGYVGPVAGRYLTTLEEKVADVGIPGKCFVMGSNGGISSIGRGRRLPINLIESGPAGGVIGAAVLGRELGFENLITLDVGGTTAKCSLIDRGTVSVVTEYHLERTRTHAGYPVRAPVVDILEIGAGGGSIAWRDDEGAVRVGPVSAGADPGPASYGRPKGTNPTVTDAHLLAGRIDPAYFLGGTMPLKVERAREAYSGLAGELDLTVQETAWGILRIAGGNMVNALKIISVQRGHDPRDFALVAMGGGGPLHAAYLARELCIGQVIIPVAPGHFSATGMLNADLRRDYIRTAVSRTDVALPATLEAAYQELESQARHEHGEDGSGTILRFAREADMRYRGQEHTVHVQAPEGRIDENAVSALEDRFHAAHRRKYSFQLDSGIEIVNLHLVAYGVLEKPRRKSLGPRRELAPEPAASRQVWFEDVGCVDTPSFRRERLSPGFTIRGPAVVEEPASVTLVYPGMGLTVRELGELVISTNA